MRTACLQLCSGLDIARNVKAVLDGVAEATASGASYVQTPEMTTVVDRDRRRLTRTIADGAVEGALQQFADCARDRGIWLHIGSTAVSLADGRLANRAFLFAPDGGLAAHYDKIHLFDVDLEDGESWRESTVYEAGGRAVVADLTAMRLGLTICYDLRFPHLYRVLAKAGADLMSAPAAFTRQTGRAHWHVLQRARAIENGAFVASAAQGGRHEDGRETFGHSLIVNPRGEIIAEADNDEPGVIVADLDVALVAEARRRIPSLRNERPFVVADEVQPARVRSAS